MKKIILVFLYCVIINAQMPRLLVKIPTKSRPEQLLKNLDIYYKKLSGNTDCHFLISCNADDDTMNNAAIIEQLSCYKNLSVRFGDIKNKIDAYNRDIDEFIDSFDILVVASDDMIPVKQGYDQIIANYMLKFFPDYDGTLHFFDGHVGQATNTMPVIGKKYYQRFGYIYYPEYQSMYCDNEFTLVAKILKKEAYINELVVEHLAPAWGKAYQDDLYRHNNGMVTQDESLFKERQARFFDLDIQAIEQASEIFWSILICTIPERQEHFSYICNKLNAQIQALGLQNQIEICSFLDNYEHSIGYKRNALLAQSQGKYINFIDDDDDISDDYIASISKVLLLCNPDCIYFKRPEQNKFHFYPIRRIIAIQFSFLDQNIMQEVEWMREVMNSSFIKVLGRTNNLCYLTGTDQTPGNLPAVSITIIDQKNLDVFYQYSCSTKASLYNTYTIARLCLKNNIPGDFVNCGVLFGAHVATMALATLSTKSPKVIHLFDQAQGIDQIPEGNRLKQEFDEEQVTKIRYLLQQTKTPINRFLLHFGPYEEIIPQESKSITAISFLRLHTNNYEHTKLCLEQLYPKISLGGYIVIDNYYCYEECQRAVTEFLTQYNIQPLIKPIQGGNGAIYWQIQ